MFLLCVGLFIIFMSYVSLERLVKKKTNRKNLSHKEIWKRGKCNSRKKEFTI